MPLNRGGVLSGSGDFIVAGKALVGPPLDEFVRHIRKRKTFADERIDERIVAYMKCPYCGSIEDKVVDSRSAEDGSFIRRRRLCEKCGERFTTFEKIETIELMVIKKDGTREMFDREKIKRGIMRACEKRKVTGEQIENMVKDVEQSLVSSMQKEIHSEKIGEAIMEKLKEVDKVAYVRFASVYREFKDVDTFMDELKMLISDK